MVWETGCFQLTSIELQLKLFQNVTLEHKTSHKGQFLEIEIYASPESWINMFSIDVWFVMIGQYLAEMIIWFRSGLRSVYHESFDLKAELFLTWALQF